MKSTLLAAAAAIALAGNSAALDFVRTSIEVA
jgi:hypothetical protein